MGRIIQPIGDKIIIPKRKMWMGLEDHFPPRLLNPRLSKMCILTPGSSPSASPSGDTGWSDDFSAASDGYLEARTGWNANTREMSAGGDQPNHLQILAANDRVSFAGGHDGMIIFNLATYTPSSANYYAQVDAWGSTDAYHIFAVIVRGSYTAGTNTLNGYVLRGNPSDDYLIVYRVVDGVDTNIASIELAGTVWSTSHTFKLAVSGTGDTVTLDYYLDGALKDSFEDTNAARIVTTGRAGILAEHTVGQTVYHDNFSIGY